MDSPVVAMALISAVIGMVAYALHHYIVRMRRHAEFDGGVVSQSWLTEHRAGKQDDRYS